MTTYVLTRPENAVSAVKLGWPVVHNSDDVPAGSKVIRWGDSLSPEGRSWPLVINKKAALQMSVDKLSALQSMARVVAVPKIFIPGTTTPRGMKTVVRNGNHSGGEGFEVVNGNYYVNDGEHATEFLTPSREYRAWFVRERMLVAKRIPRSSQGQTEDDQCRSQWGYSFVATAYPKLVEEVKKVRLAIPLDFGAMDVLWHENAEGHGKWYFLEVNSAPSLDLEKIELFFRNGLKDIIGPDTAPEVARTQTRRVDPAVGRSLVEPGEVQSVTSSIRSRVAAKAKADYDRMYAEEIERLSR